jgi:hypothetical protein
MGGAKSEGLGMLNTIADFVTNTYDKCFRWSQRLGIVPKLSEPEEKVLDEIKYVSKIQTVVE